MTKQQWHELSAHLSERRPRSVGITVLIFATDLALLAGSWNLAHMGGLLKHALASCLLLLALIHIYLVLHEAIHHSVSNERRLNDAIGHLAGWIILLPFLPRQRNHLLHHVWAAHPVRDPENSKMIERFSVITRERAVRVERLWRSWLPVIALNHFIATWWSPFEHLRAQTKEKAPTGARYANEARWAKTYVAGYIVLAALLAVSGSGLLFVRWFVPVWLVFLMVVEMLNLPHHAEAPLLPKDGEALPYWRQDAVAHNCGSLPLWSKFIILNFNLHIAHHLFPTVPWYELPSVERLIQEKSAGDRARFKDEFTWAFVNRRRPLLELMGHFFDKRTGAYENRRPTIHGP